MGRALLLLFASACSISSLDLSTKSCPCPSGWECGPENLCVREGTVVDAGIDANCALDQDRDSVNDCADNCPQVENTAQYNEDGDARGDACDLCPGDVDDGSNADGDGVGDACDPDPASNKERIHLFEGFHTGLPMGWTTTGTWSHVDGAAVVTSGVDQIGNLAIDDPLPNGRSWLVGKFTVGELFDPGTSTRYVSLVRRWNSANDNNVRCLLYQPDVGAATELALRDTGITPPLYSSLPSSFATGQTERFVFEQDAMSYRCTNGSQTLMGTTTVNSIGARIGLRTRSVSASYAWMMVIVRD